MVGSWLATKFQACTERGSRRVESFPGFSAENTKRSPARLRREEEPTEISGNQERIHFAFFPHHCIVHPSALFRLEYVLPSLSPLPLIQALSMISHYPLATLRPWPAGPQHHCPDLDFTLLLEGDGGVALQRYQPRSPDSSPHHWVSTRHNDTVLHSCSTILQMLLLK